MKKLDINFIRNSFKKEGYILLSNLYLNSKEKLKFICSKGHKHEITWSDFKTGKRCRYCIHNKLGKSRRISFSKIKNSFSKEGYELLSKHYKNCDQKLKYRCPNGHIHSISWHNWNSGWRCAHCHREKLSIFITGSGHPQWKGGVSCDPYCDAWADKEYKESIKERDGYSCLNPYCDKKVKQLTIHHIDYNKKNCRPNNLITICKSCNSKANFDRDWHMAWYQAIINKRIEIRRN